MRISHSAALLVLAAAALAACDRGPDTAYNNSGNSASANPVGGGQTSSAPAPAIDTSAASAQSAPSAPGGAPGETATSGKILAAIAADPGMKDADVNVKTEGGVVTLGGTVDSPDQVATATSIAQRQEGVAQVESNITVR